MTAEQRAELELFIKNDWNLTQTRAALCAMITAHDRHKKALEKISQMDEMRLVAADDGGGYLVCRYCGEVSEHNEDCPILIAEEALCD